MTDQDFYEPTRCAMCGTTDLWGQLEVIRSPDTSDGCFVYVVCSDCRRERNPTWDGNGFLLYPAARVAVIEQPVIL